MKVPFQQPGRYFQARQEAIADCVAEVIASGYLIKGPRTEAFEREFADFLGLEPPALLIGNATDGLELALRTLRAGPGSKVVTVANAGFYGTAAIRQVGATPIFVDVDRDHLANIDAIIAACLSDSSIIAVIATHLYGNVLNVTDLRRRLPRQVAIIEDCSQAHGATLGQTRVGSMSDIGVFSFYPTKNLPAMGDAGSLTFRSRNIRTRAAQLSQYGWSDKYTVTLGDGRNSRADEIQAAILSLGLEDLDARNKKRREIAHCFADALPSGMRAIVQHGQNTVAHLCVVEGQNASELAKTLQASGISSAVHYPIPDHRQPLDFEFDVCANGLFETERLIGNMLSLPCYPEMTDEEINAVFEVLSRA